MFILFFLLLCSQSAQCEEWVVLKDSVPLHPMADEEELFTLLREAKIPIRLIDNPALFASAAPATQKKENAQPHRERHLFWRGRQASIALEKEGGRCHLYLEPNEKREWIDQLTLNERRALNSCCRRVQGAFVTAFGSGHFLEFIPSREMAGGAFRVELLPSFPPDFSLQEKVSRSLYMVTHGKYGSLGFDADEEALSLLEKAISAGSTEAATEEGRFFSLCNVAEAIDFVAHNYFQFLKDQGFARSLEEKEPPLPEPSWREPPQLLLTFDPKPCPFCTPAVIDSHVCFENPGRSVYLFCNRRPYVLGNHFLIVTKEHRAAFEEITEEELLDKWELMARIEKIRPQVRSWMQNGILAGQTVSHYHSHLLTNDLRGSSHFFSSLLTQLTSNRRADLTAEEMGLLAEAIRQELDEE